MGFGALIALGDGNAPLAADLAGCIAEVRVEQTLDGPAQFAVRFLDDIEDGRLRLASDDRLKVETIVTMAVEIGELLEVLVRGPITEHRSQMTIGGPGSWFEVHGLDRRDLFDRICVQAAWTGAGVGRGAADPRPSIRGTNVEDTARSLRDDQTR